VSKIENEPKAPAVGREHRWALLITLTVSGTLVIAAILFMYRHYEADLHRYTELVENCRLVEAVAHAEETGIFDADELRRRAIDLVNSALGPCRENITPESKRGIARFAQRLNVPSRIVAHLASQAFEELEAERGSSAISYLDDIAHEFPEAIQHAQHMSAVHLAYTNDFRLCSSLDSKFCSRHPRTPSIAIGAFELAKQRGMWTQARGIASYAVDHGILGLTAQDYNDARAQELRALFEAAIEADDLFRAYRIATNQDKRDLALKAIDLTTLHDVTNKLFTERVEQRHYEDALKIARHSIVVGAVAHEAMVRAGEAYFVELTSSGHHRAALELARSPDITIDDDAQHAAAIALFEALLKADNPLAAHRAAMRYDLDETHRFAAAMFAFNHAVAHGNYTIGRQLPDGTIIILSE
jgi:hypothetical protein